MTYQDKIRLTALWKQASVGKYDTSKIPEIGYFDVIGNDRRYVVMFTQPGQQVFMSSINYWNF